LHSASACQRLFLSGENNMLTTPTLFIVIKLEYGGMVKVWRFEWGSLYLWKGVRASPFGRYEYGYITVYVKAKFTKVAEGAKRWLQKTIYVGKDVLALAGKLVAAAPWLSWSEALKKAKETIREVVGKIESAFSAFRVVKREFWQALSRGPDAAEAVFDRAMEGVEFVLDDVRRTLKDVLAELPDT